MSKKLLPACMLQILSGVFWLRLLQIASSHQVSTRPGENVALLCNIIDYLEISWYRLRSEEVKMLISAKQGRLNKEFHLSYSVQEGHFEKVESNSGVDLLIIGVSESDLGFYYCVGRTDTEHMQFGKPIELKFADTTSVLVSDPQQFSHLGIIIIILSCVCAVSVSVAIICCCLYCSMQQDQCCSTWDFNDKEAELQPHDMTTVTYTSAP